MQMVPSQIEIPSATGVSCDAGEYMTKLTVPQKERRRALVVPREHGAWGMLLIPLITGAAVGLLAGGHVAPVLLLTTTVLALFWLRTPVESWLGTSAVRVQTRQERRLVRGVILPLATIAAVSLGALLWQGKNRELMWIALIGGAAFAAQTVLGKLGRGTRMAGEMAGALALTATAPAAYCVATGDWMPERGRCGWSTGCSLLTRSTLCGSESVGREPPGGARSSRWGGVSWPDRSSSGGCWRLRTISDGCRD